MVAELRPGLEIDSPISTECNGWDLTDCIMTYIASSLRVKICHGTDNTDACMSLHMMQRKGGDLFQTTRIRRRTRFVQTRRMLEIRHCEVDGTLRAWIDGRYLADVTLSITSPPWYMAPGPSRFSNDFLREHSNFWTCNPQHPCSSKRLMRKMVMYDVTLPPWLGVEFY